MVGNSLTSITTSALEEGHTPLEMVQRKVADVPGSNPVTPEVGEEGVVVVAEPATTDQAPVPIPGELPAKVVVVTLHKVCAGPASATVGRALMVITTSSEEEVQEPFETVQRKVADAPIANPVTSEVGDAGVVMVAVPEITVHSPVPTVGVFPASVAVEILHKV